MIDQPKPTVEWTAKDFELLCASDAELRAKQVNERYRRLLHDWTVLEQEVACEREKRKEDSIIYEKLADALDAKCQTLATANLRLVDALKDAKQWALDEHKFPPHVLLEQIDAALANVK